MKKICVVGLGYIGLPTAVMFAHNNFEVVGVDIDKKVISDINNDEIDVKDKNLNEIIKSVVNMKTLYAKAQPEEADAFIIAVPTPCKDDKSCDLSYLISAVKSILPYLHTGNLVIVESTVEPLTTNTIVKPMIEGQGFKVGTDIYLAFCPERVLPDKVLHEIIYNNRIIGGCTPKCAQLAANLYRSFVKGEIFITDSQTAEMTKLMENTFRDINIAFANELVTICNKLHIDGLEVIALANKHPRVNILMPGPGVGGHCIAVDPYFVASKLPKLSRLILTARQVNCDMPEYIVSKVKQLTTGIETPKIAILGAAYKGNIGDVRESPALEIIKLLKNDGFVVDVYDPYVNQQDIKLTTLEKAVENSDLILILTDHNVFKDIDYHEIVKRMRTPQIFDTKNIIDIKGYNKGQITIFNLGSVFDMQD